MDGVVGVYPDPLGCRADCLSLARCCCTSGDTAVYGGGVFKTSLAGKRSLYLAYTLSRKSINSASGAVDLGVLRDLLVNVHIIF